MSTMTRALTRRVPRPSNNPIMEATTQEEFEKLFGIAIAKAIDTQEVPVKEKHLRTLIIASYKEKGAGTFWINFIRLQIEGSPILSWKFCHVLHKLLNEGHKNCIADSLKYRSKINDLGKLWSHLKEGYGQLILTYCKLILTKLEFHHRVRNVYGFSASYEIPLRTQNINVSGNLQLSDEQLEALGQHDVNTWFQLCVEMLDYVEDILALQRSVFNSLDMSRATSMTTSGQCKLAPLIICIQEASLLYDYLVKMMFKLYAALPPDILVGHQDRFNNLFKTLKQFYYTSSNLQYFKYLVSIPTLPETPPNFLIESDLKSYVSPQVLLHSDTAEHDTTDSPPDNRSIASVPLVDLNNDNRENKQKVEESFAAELMEKDITINSLKRDLGDVKATLLNHQQQASQTAQKFQKQILELQKELLKEKSLVEQLDEENSHYRSQAEELQNEKNQNTVSRLEESERKAQLAAEKLKKMKDVYAKLREEHIESLKKLANVQKDFECTRKSAEDFASEKNILETNYQELLRKIQVVENEKLQTESENEQCSTNALKTLKELDATKKDLEANQKALNEEKNHHASVVAEMQTSLESLSSKCKLFEDYYWRLFECICNQCFNLMCDTLDQFDNPAHLGVTCSPEFVLSMSPSCSEAIDQTRDALQKISASQELFSEEFLVYSGSLINCANLFSELLIHGKATANAAPSNLVEKLENLCRLLATDSKVLFDSKSRGSWSEADSKFINVKNKLEELSSLFRNLLGKMGDVSAEELGDMFEKEMQLMDKAVQEAASKIQEIMTKSKQECTGVRLEVNSKILDACTMLMMAVIELVKKSWNLQQEIVQDGRGTGSVKDFYKRHHQWTEGLVSAAKSVGVGAKVLVDSADRVISGQGKFEELIAASREIAASTAQLVVSSKVKAEKNSQRMSELSAASRAVTSATANVLGTVKSGREIFEEKDSLDFSNLSLHQAKRTEMEVQVKVLELECALEMERKRLAEIRKVHYQLAGPAEGWEKNDV